MASLAPLIQHYHKNDESLAAGYWLAFYEAGTTTDQDTFTDQGGATPNTNPLQLDARGEAVVWYDPTLNYKVILSSDALGTNVIWEMDVVGSIPDASVFVIDAKGAAIASATAINLQAATGNYVHITGSVTIGTVTLSEGQARWVTYDATPTLTHSANLILPNGGLDITVAAGNSMCFRGEGSGVTKCVAYMRFGGVPVKSELQKQTFTKFTTGGTPTAFTLTPSPVITANTAGTRFSVTFNADAGASPTLAVSGLAALNLKYINQVGTKQFITDAQVKSGWIADVESDGTDWVVLDIPSIQRELFNVAASVGSSALTITLNPDVIDFRSSTLTDGAPVKRLVSSPLSLVISSGSTLGSTNGVESDIVVVAIDNAGTVELAAVNVLGNNNLDETTLITTTAEGGIGGADSVSIFYSAAARASVAFRVVGLVKSTQATAGTWATPPSQLQGMGGLAGNSLFSSSLVAFTTITATDGAWSTNSITTKLVVCVGAGGGGGGGVSNTANLIGGGGSAGAVKWDVSTSISGNYAATIGAGGTGSGGASGNAGSNSSFIGTGISATAIGGLGGIASVSISSLANPTGFNGESLFNAGGVGAAGGVSGSVGGAAAANSGSGGGGGSAGTAPNSTESGGSGGSGIIYVWEFA